jgi:glycerol-3-phosphate acyltransferase PlsX
MLRLALDAMGGDLGHVSVVAGVADYIKKCDSVGVSFVLYGKESLLSEELAKHGLLLDKRCRIVDTKKVITSCMKPSSAMRHGRGSSMYEAIKSVSLGETDAVVSSGNTGAYMALSMLLLKTIDGVERPALLRLLPTVGGGECVVLDLGANVECSSSNLVQFCVMGSSVARVLLNVSEPKVSLLNIGTERCKGTSQLKEVSEYFDKNPIINFHGFVEGSDIPFGKSDVIVTDGFSGNIALKTMEGTIKYLATLVKDEIHKSFIRKLAYMLGRGIVRDLKSSIDPRTHNGALLVGLNGIVVKSHGNSDHVGFSSAISAAVSFVKNKLIENIKAGMKD